MVLRYGSPSELRLQDGALLGAGSGGCSPSFQTVSTRLCRVWVLPPLEPYPEVLCCHLLPASHPAPFLGFAHICQFYLRALALEPLATSSLCKTGSLLFFQSLFKYTPPRPKFSLTAPPIPHLKQIATPAFSSLTARIPAQRV